MSPRLNHILFNVRPRLTRAGKVALVAAAGVVLVALVWANWGAIASLTMSPEQRFLAAYNGGDLDRALAIAEKMAANDPGSAIAQQAIATVFIERALRNEDVEASLAAAMSAALKAEQLDRASAEPQRLIGYVLELRGDLAGAELRYREGLKIAPNDAAIIAQLASVYERRGKGDSARTLYERALVADAGSVQARVFFARFLLQDGDRQGAIAQARQATGSPVVAYAAEANRVVSASYLSMGEVDLARPYAELALELAPNSSLAVQNYGELRLAELFGPNRLPYDETLAEVRTLVDRAIGLNPNLAQPYYLGFRAAYAQNDKAAASEYAAAALSRLAADPNLSSRSRIEILRVIEAVPTVTVSTTRR